MSTSQAIQPARTLTSALSRLKEIDVRLAAANQLSQRFLDALVGQKASPGQANTAGAQVQSTCFVSDLHRLIDSIESEAFKASRRATDLLEAAGCEEGEAVSTGALYQSQASNLLHPGSADLAAQRIL